MREMKLPDKSWQNSLELWSELVASVDGSSAAMVCSYIFCGKPWTYAYALISLVVGPVCADCLQQYKQAAVGYAHT